MADEPILSILIPAVAWRPWRAIYNRLLTQARRLDFPKGLHSVEVLYQVDSGELTSGVKRQRLVDRARGKYLAFVDDDDWVAPNYVARIVEECASNPDVVTFDLLMMKPNGRQETWRYGLQGDIRWAGMMAANHLCAWRADLARLVGWCPYLGYGDDQLWYQPLMMTGRVETERHVHEALYIYRYDPALTLNQKPDVIDAALAYVRGGLACYWHRDSVAIAKGGPLAESTDSRSVEVINWKGNHIAVPASELKYLGTVQLKG